MAAPVRPHPSRPPSQAIAASLTDPPSVSSSLAGNTLTRSDQIIYRYYVKMLEVLAEARVAQPNGNGGKGKERKDKWFNLALPEMETYKEDLKLYRSVSAFPRLSSTSAAGADPCSIPPLLVAFILDTRDIPNGQTLTWLRNGSRITLDIKGKGKEKEVWAGGIVLERWTFRARDHSALPEDPSSSSTSAQAAYRHGICHFRALYSLLRVMPSHRLTRRLRLRKSGLRIGLKLWAADGYPNSAQGIQAAWREMESDLVGLHTPLEQLSTSEHLGSEARRDTYAFPPVQLFGAEYELSTEYRHDVDFQVEDLESVLSEKFVDMEEDWFSPTNARLRAEQAAADPSAKEDRSRKLSMPAAIPSSTSPIPHRQPAAHLGSFGSAAGSLHRLSGTRAVTQPSSVGRGKTSTGSVGDRWSQFAQGLPFASRMVSDSAAAPREPISPSALQPLSPPSIAARRLSGQSISSFTAPQSPSAASPRASPMPLNTPQPYRPGSSVGRTSSFLSQSGRSVTYAQLANMYPASASPPVTGAMSGLHYPNTSPAGMSPASPSSLSISQRAGPGSLTRPSALPHQPASPFLPGSIDRDGQSPSAPPQLVKRYSSSLSQRSAMPRPSATTVPGQAGSSGSPEGAVIGSTGLPGALRRASTRTSQESGLRYSLDDPRPTAPPQPDNEDIEAFLKLLDDVPSTKVPPQHTPISRPHLPSTTSSLSNPSHSQSQSHSPSPLQASADSLGPSIVPPVQASAQPAGASPSSKRLPLTRAQVDEQLRQMAGSFNISSSGVLDTPTSPQLTSVRRSSGLLTAGPGPGAGVGLLTASRPASAPRRVTPTTEASRPGFRRQGSGPGGPLSVKAGSPLASSPPILPAPARIPVVNAEPEVKDSQGPALAPPNTAPDEPALAPLPVPAPADRVVPRSLPGFRAPPMSGDAIHPLPSAGPLAGAGGLSFAASPALSPQTTGGLASPAFDGQTRTGRRTGPVLLRGGFGEQRQHHPKPSASSSPSHSPVRDLQRLGVGLGTRGMGPGPAGGGGLREGRAEEELEGWSRSVSGGGNGNGNAAGRFRSLGTAVGQSRQRGSLPPLGYVLSGSAGGSASVQKGEEDARREEEEDRERGRARARERDRVKSEGSGPTESSDDRAGLAGQTYLRRDW